MRHTSACLCAPAVVAALAAHARAGLYGVTLDGGLYEISTVDASVSTINADTGVLLGSLEWDPAGKRLLGMSYGGQAGLFAIDPQTGAATSIGPAGRFVFEGALQFSPAGVLYATSGGNADSPRLLTVNPGTGATAVVGTMSPGGHDINGLAWRSDGKMVGIDGVSNALVVIDPATAAVTTLVELSPLVGALGGMTTGTGDTGYFCLQDGELYSLDLFTGEPDYIGTLPEHTMGLAYIPAPGGPLLWVGAACAAGPRRRRR